MTTDITATLASEPATRRHGWPLLVGLHTSLWAVVLLSLVLSSRTFANGDTPLHRRGLAGLVGHFAGWVHAYWPLALFGLAAWMAIDGLVMLLLSRDPIGRGYRFWNIGQFLIAGLALLAIVGGLIVMLATPTNLSQT